MTEEMRISASGYNRWHLCNRYFYWESIVRIERVREAPAASFGKLIHEALDKWWRAMSGGNTPWRDADAALVAALKAIHDAANHIDVDPFDIAKAEAMIIAYHARYYELDFDDIDGDDGVERAFDVPMRDERMRIVPGWRVVGRKDAIKRFANGRIQVAEHKSTGSPVHVGADLWDRVKIDHQISIYIDAARELGFDTYEALYDVARRPDLRPYKRTPDDKRKLTKGKGCVHCGGRAGGKGGVAQGTGRIMVRTRVDGDGNDLGKWVEVESTCTSCDGTGWNEAPRLQSNQRDADETPAEYKLRVADELASDPDAYFRMAVIPRTDAQLAEARADLVTTTGIIGAMVELARSASHGNMNAPEARRAFARNTRACLSVYGSRCPMLEVCSGAENAFDSRLYRVRAKRDEVPR